MGARGSGGHGRVGPAKKGSETALQDRTEDCTPPDGMADDAVGYWRYYAALQVRRGLLTESSRDTLRSYCQVLVQRDRIEVGLRDSPVLIVSTVVDGAGNEHPKVSANPLLAAQRQTEQTLHTLANDLALPPASAIRLPPRNESETDDLDEWGGVTGPRIKAVK
jgi:phage terminase small subunit